MAQHLHNTEFKGDVTHLSLKHRMLVTGLKLFDDLTPALSARVMLSKFLTPRRKQDCAYMQHLPEGAKRLNIYHNLTRLTGWKWGDSGPSVLLVHGWESHTGRMIPLIQPLLQEGYRVFTLDAPGHGYSPSAQTHLQDVGAAIQSMIEQHGPFHGIIGHSFGAAATAIMLASEPHLAPSRLVLLAPMRDLQLHLDIFSGIARLSQARKDRLQALVERRIGLPFTHVSALNAVRRLAVPGLVIHDRDDALIPCEVGATIATNWRGARFVATERLGHRQGLNNPQVFSHIVDHLKSGIHSGRIVPFARAPQKVS